MSHFYGSVNRNERDPCVGALIGAYRSHRHTISLRIPCALYFLLLLCCGQETQLSLVECAWPMDDQGVRCLR